MNTNNCDTWNVWSEIHSSPGQETRLDSARAAACTPLRVSPDCGTAEFKGSKGVYQTSLNSCGCEDFRRRNIPCKHMYRLALELELIPGPFSSYLHGGYDWKQVIEIVERLPDDAQREFSSHLRSSSASPAPYRRKKSPEIDALIAAEILMEYPEKETAKFKTVRMVEDFMADKRRVSWYFSRKFSPPTYTDGENFIVSEYPDDEVTAYLFQRGAAVAPGTIVDRA